jgi:DNA-binding transcriptional MerR regulator
MSAYTVSQLAQIAGVSVRTLHYYDEIGLLQPSDRSPAGYRLYRHPELMRLQQILLYRELDLPLVDIRAMLEAPDFDAIETLHSHRASLMARRERLEEVIETVDRTIHQLTEGQMSMKDEELFAAFTPERTKRYRKEARQRWGEENVQESEERLRKLPKDEWQKIQAEGERIAEELAGYLDRQPDDDEVQVMIARHHAWIENFYPAPAEVYRGLGQMYIEHPEFRAFYDKYGEGLAIFLKSAMDIFADTKLKE